MSDSSDIDNALIAKLSADGPLLALMPNGVYWQVAPSNSTRYVVVELVTSHDEPVFGGRAWESAIYQVKAVGRSTPSVPLQDNAMKDAAARIDALLENGTLSIPGFTLMSMRRVEDRIRVTEQDPADPAIKWFHRGGRYEVVASP